jgi:hypothetical protein
MDTIDNRAALRGAGDCDPSSAAEIEQSLLTQATQRPEHGVRVYPDDRRQVLSGRQPLAGRRLAIGDRASDLGSHALVEVTSFGVVQLDFQHGARQNSVIPPVTTTPAHSHERELEALIEEARRRTRRRRFGYLAAIVASLALAGGLYLAFGGGGEGKSPPREPTGSGPTPSVAAHGVRMKLEPGWHVAAQTLTPSLVSPRELLSVGTFHMRPDRPNGRCAQAPRRAYSEMRASDGLITIMEEGGRQTGFPPRPATFRLHPRPGSLDCAGPTVQSQEFAFRDAGRNFYTFIALGARGPVDEAESMLNSLRATRTGR